MPSQSSRVACLRFPHFALAMELVALGRPHTDHPLVLCDASRTPARVSDASASAQRGGVVPGMLVRNALARCPTAEFLSADPSRARALHGDWLDALEQASPIVAGHGADLDCVFVALDGLSPLHGGELGSIAVLQATTKRALGVEPQIGIADTPFAAALAARRAIPAAAVIVPAGHVPHYLAEMDLDYLPLDHDTCQRVRRLFGLRTIGEFAALPVSAVQAQFGPLGKAAWDLAHGREDHQLQPRPRQERIADRLTFPDPVASVPALVQASRHLITRLLGQPALRQRALRQVQVWVQVEHGPRWERQITLREATRDADRIALAVRSAVERLGGRPITLPGPVEAIGIAFAGLGPERGTQSTLWSSQGKQTEPIREALRQLETRAGKPLVFRAVEVEPWSRVPERRTALIAYGR